MGKALRFFTLKFTCSGSVKEKCRCNNEVIILHNMLMQGGNPWHSVKLLWIFSLNTVVFFKLQSIRFVLPSATYLKWRVSKLGGGKRELNDCHYLQSVTVYLSQKMWLKTWLMDLDPLHQHQSASAYIHGLNYWMPKLVFYAWWKALLSIHSCISYITCYTWNHILFLFSNHIK